MKFQTLIPSVLMASSVLLSTAAQAQNIADTGWFVGGQISQADLKLESRNQEELSFDAPMLEARGGFRFSPYFAIESTLGLTVAGSSSNDDVDDPSLLKLSTAAKLIAPINDRVQLYANAGLAILSYAYEERGSYSYNIYPYRSRYNDTHNYVGNNFLIGLGIEFEVSPSLVLRLAYDSMSGELEYEGDGDGDYYRYSAPDLDATLSQIGVGLHYQF